MIYLIVAVLFALLVYQSIVGYYNKRDLIELLKQSNNMLEHGLDKWEGERQKLLDRIQAPSFADYKQAEVRVIKAQNNEKEPPKLEQL